MLEFLKACIITVVIETAFFAVLAYRKRDDLLIVVLANVITNPSLNVIFGLCWLYAPEYAWIALAALEILAVLIEWLIYRALTDAKRPFITSLAANAVSFGIGVIIMSII